VAVVSSGISSSAAAPSVRFAKTSSLSALPPNGTPLIANVGLIALVTDPSVNHLNPGTKRPVRAAVTLPHSAKILRASIRSLANASFGHNV